MSKQTLQEALEKLAAPMALAQDGGAGRVRCVACGHRCLIPEGRVGLCLPR